MKYEVIVTRTRVETASFEVSAANAEEAEQKVRRKLEPDFRDAAGSEVTGLDWAKLEKSAERYFDSHPADGADNTTEFEYETEEFT